MDDLEYKAARRRVVRRFIWQATFFMNLLFFVLMLLQFILSRAQLQKDWMGLIIVMLVYLPLLVIHGSVAFIPSGGIINRWIDRAARRELERQELSEKPKRHRLELGEDGELNEVIDDLPLDNKAKHSEGI